MTQITIEKAKLEQWLNAIDMFAGEDRQKALYEASKEMLQALAAPVQEPVAWLEILRNNKTATDEVIGAFLRGHAEHLTGETFVLTTPPAAAVQEGRDWSLLEATQESLREHMAEIKRLKEAQPAVPDAMTSADIQEHIEYVAGWNDCRAEMLKGMK